MGKYDPQTNYDKRSTVAMMMKLNRKTDADILQRLEDVGNKQGYVKALIRADIKKEKENDHENQGIQQHEEPDL